MLLTLVQHNSLSISVTNIDFCIPSSLFRCSKSKGSIRYIDPIFISFNIYIDTFIETNWTQLIHSFVVNGKSRTFPVRRSLTGAIDMNFVIIFWMNWVKMEPFIWYNTLLETEKLFKPPIAKDGLLGVGQTYLAKMLGTSCNGLIWKFTIPAVSTFSTTNLYPNLPSWLWMISVSSSTRLTSKSHFIRSNFWEL